MGLPWANTFHITFAIREKRILSLSVHMMTNSQYNIRVTCSYNFLILAHELENREDRITSSILINYVDNELIKPLLCRTSSHESTYIFHLTINFQEGVPFHSFRSSFDMFASLLPSHWITSLSTIIDITNDRFD